MKEKIQAIIDKHAEELSNLREYIDGEVCEFTDEWIGRESGLKSVIKDLEALLNEEQV